VGKDLVNTRRHGLKLPWTSSRRESGLCAVGHARHIESRCAGVHRPRPASTGQVCGTRKSRPIEGLFRGAARLLLMRRAPRSSTFRLKQRPRSAWTFPWSAVHDLAETESTL